MSFINGSLFTEQSFTNSPFSAGNDLVDDFELQELSFPVAKRPRLGLDEKKTAPADYKSIMRRIELQAQISYNGNVFHLDKVPGAHGDFVQCYELAGRCERSIIDGIPNEKVLVKAFHETTCNRNGPNQIKKFMESSLKQYRELQQIAPSYYRQMQPMIGDGLHTATIYNADTAIRDGFYIVEYIPYPVDISSWKERTVRFEDLDAKSQNLLKEVKRFMHFMVDQNISIDLKPSNIRLDDTDTPYLVDYSEESDDGILIQLRQTITLWSGENPHIKEFLTDDLAIIEELVDRHAGIYMTFKKV